MKVFLFIFIILFPSVLIFAESSDTEDLLNKGRESILLSEFEKAGLNEIVSFTAIRNIRSEQIMKKIGMIKTGEFDHPKLSEGHCLKRHVLYKILAD